MTTVIDASTMRASTVTSLVVRPAMPTDVGDLLLLARRAGQGLTNLPADEAALAARIERSMRSLQDSDASFGGAYYLLVLVSAGEKVVGTASLFASIGFDLPFYSYRLTRLRQTHPGMNVSVPCDVLQLVNELDGASEVGGLFVDPAWRGGGAGGLLARSRYLFIAQHRDRFSDHIIADLRGYQAADGSWPLWDAIGRHFFGMSFEEADRINGLHGNQFIADLMPKYPVYVSMLPPAAQAAIGRTHDDGLHARHLLEREGFRASGLVDIFDGGPTLAARADELATVRDSILAPVGATDLLCGGAPKLVAAGHLGTFRCAVGALASTRDAACHLAPALAAQLGVTTRDTIRYATF